MHGRVLLSFFFAGGSVLIGAQIGLSVLYRLRPKWILDRVAAVFGRLLEPGAHTCKH